MTRPTSATPPSNPSAQGSVLGLTPDGIVVCRISGHPLHRAFAVSEPAALIALGGNPSEPSSDLSCRFWKSIADHFIRSLCQIPENDDPLAELSAPDATQLATWTLLEAFSD